MGADCRSISAHLAGSSFVFVSARRIAGSPVVDSWVRISVASAGSHGTDLFQLPARSVVELNVWDAS